MVLVDNNVLSFAFQLDNGIPILPYFTQKFDEELLHLLYYLQCLNSEDDVRIHNREAFNLHNLSKFDIGDILEQDEELDQDSPTDANNNNNESTLQSTE